MVCCGCVSLSADGDDMSCCVCRVLLLLHLLSLLPVVCGCVLLIDLIVVNAAVCCSSCVLSFVERKMFVLCVVWCCLL